MKYGAEDGGWFSKCPRGSYGIGPWKQIRKEVAHMHSNCSFFIEDRKRISFWEDLWCNNTPLSLSFSTHYSLTNSKGARVTDSWVDGS